MFLEIDGSEGEGGGQILRSSLAMSAVLGKPIKVKNIRAGRREPGLQAQHLTCVRALSNITNAETIGASLGSQELTFIPRDLRSGTYSFDVSEVRASAGSVSLVLQAILLPLAYAREVSIVSISGGTHVQWSPTANYLQKVYLPTAAMMGLKSNINLKRWGWYPRGGGEIIAEIHPTKLSGIDLTERGSLKNIMGISAVANLPIAIAQRQRDRALAILRSEKFGANIELVNAPSYGQGTVVFIFAEYEKSFAGFESLGAKGKMAEKVAEEACDDFIKFTHSDAAIDKHLADQLIPLMALAEGFSSFTTSNLSLHLLTNIKVAEKFLPVRFEVSGDEGKSGKVSVKGIGFERH